MILAVKTDWQEIFWFCSSALLLASIGLFTNNNFLISVQTTLALPFQGLWIADFISYLIFDFYPFGFASYMSDPDIWILDWYIGISHLFVFCILLYSCFKMKFHPLTKRGVLVQIVILCSLSFIFGNSDLNINCVYQACGFSNLSLAPPFLHFLVWMAIIFIGFALPSASALEAIKKL